MPDNYDLLSKRFGAYRYHASSVIDKLLDHLEQRGEPDPEQIWCNKRPNCPCEAWITSIKSAAEFIGRELWWKEPTDEDGWFGEESPDDERLRTLGHKRA